MLLIHITRLVQSVNCAVVALPPPVDNPVSLVVVLSPVITVVEFMYK